MKTPIGRCMSFYLVVFSLVLIGIYSGAGQAKGVKKNNVRHYYEYTDGETGKKFIFYDNDFRSINIQLLDLSSSTVREVSAEEALSYNQWIQIQVRRNTVWLGRESPTSEQARSRVISEELRSISLLNNNEHLNTQHTENHNVKEYGIIRIRLSKEEFSKNPNELINRVKAHLDSMKVLDTIKGYSIRGIHFDNDGTIHKLIVRIDDPSDINAALSSLRAAFRAGFGSVARTEGTNELIISPENDGESTSLVDGMEHQLNQLLENFGGGTSVTTATDGMNELIPPENDGEDTSTTTTINDQVEPLLEENNEDAPALTDDQTIEGKILAIEEGWERGSQGGYFQSDHDHESRDLNRGRVARFQIILSFPIATPADTIIEHLKSFARDIRTSNPKSVFILLSNSIRICQRDGNSIIVDLMLSEDISPNGSATAYHLNWEFLRHLDHVSEVNSYYSAEAVLVPALAPAPAPAPAPQTRLAWLRELFSCILPMPAGRGEAASSEEPEQPMELNRLEAEGLLEPGTRISGSGFLLNSGSK